MIADGKFLEHAEVFGHSTARRGSRWMTRASRARPDSRYRRAGRGAGARQDAGGGEYLCDAAHPKVLRTRLRNRSRAEGDERGRLYRRLREASKEIENYRDYSYIWSTTSSTGR